MSPGPRDWLNPLIAALSRAANDPTALEIILADIRATDPAQAEAADQFVRTWRQLKSPTALIPAPTPTATQLVPAVSPVVITLPALAPPALAPPMTPPPPSSGTVSQPPPVAQPAISSTTLGVGAGVLSAGTLMTLLVTNRAAIEQWLSGVLAGVPFLQTSSGVMLAAAAAGGLGGLLNAYLADTRLILPRFEAVPGDLTGERRFFAGFLGNVAAGVVAAAVTVLWPIWSGAVALPAAGAFASTLVSAFLAGLAGSRVVTGQRDKNLLWSALQDALGKPANDDRSRRVGNAKSAPEAFVLATGRALPGGAADSAPHRDLKTVEGDLTGLLDSAEMGRYFRTLQLLGKPAALTAEATGLPLGTLKAVKALGTSLPDALRDLRLIDVAGWNLDGLGRRVTAAGLDAAAIQPQLQTAWNAARAAARDLKDLPDTWQLTPDRLA